MTTNLLTACAEYALSERAWTDFKGERKGPDHQALLDDWQAKTHALTKAARLAGRRELQTLGDTVALFGAAMAKVGEPA